MGNGKSQVVKNFSSMYSLKIESEAGQKWGLVEGDNEDWGDDDLELIKDDENVYE